MFSLFTSLHTDITFRDYSGIIKNTKDDGTHADVEEEEQELAIELGASGLIKPRHENDNSGGRHHMVIVFIWLALL